MSDQKRVLCSSCDIYCQVLAEVSYNGAARIKATDNAPFRANICMKGVHAPEGFLHPDRIRFPLRRVGERGSGRWERVTWDHALDDIALRLSAVTEQYGQEGFAVSASPWNLQSDAAKMPSLRISGFRCGSVLMRRCAWVGLKLSSTKVFTIRTSLRGGRQGLKSFAL